VTSIFDVFSSTAEAFADRPFVHIPAAASSAYSDGPVDSSYGEAAGRIAALAGAYEAAGYRRGHRVGLVMENRLEFFLHFIAMNSLGVSVVPVNAEFRPEEIAYIVSHSDLGVLVCLPGHAPRMAGALADNSVDVPVVEAGAGLPPAAGAMVASADEAAMLYTSGTTGRPKGCMLSNYYFVRMGQWYRDLGGYCTLRPGQERLITPLPLVHMNALACSTMGMIQTGGCIVQLDRFHASSWWQSVRDSRATCLHYLGVMPAILLNLSEEARTMRSAARSASASAPAWTRNTSNVSSSASAFR
jgi:acyl-CoA synthetase (AMP-forming)/AMP-acid ligase II